MQCTRRQLAQGHQEVLYSEPGTRHSEQHEAVGVGAEGQTEESEDGQRWVSVSTFLIVAVECICSFTDLPNTNIDDE